MEKYPEADLKTYVVWFNMVATDTRKGWKPSHLSDSRIRHFWDADRSVGKWVAENVDTCKHIGKIAWDSYYLLDKDATWGDTLGPIESCGSPVFRTTEDFTKDLEALLKQ